MEECYISSIPKHTRSFSCPVVNTMAVATSQEVQSLNPSSGLDVCSTPDSTLNVSFCWALIDFCIAR